MPKRFPTRWLPVVLVLALAPAARSLVPRSARTDGSAAPETRAAATAFVAHPRLAARLDSIAARRGLSRSHAAVGDDRAIERARVFEYRLQAGASYVVLAACSGSCAGPDLDLRDQNGRRVDRGGDRDGTAMVSVTPRWSGVFRLTVGRTSCRSRCSWVAAVYRRIPQL